ncbi:MAG: RNA-guided endonuclease InsQ/TnpB family protein [Thermoplasmata archaeon]
MTNKEKNSMISLKGRETRAKMRSQDVKVFELKFDKSKISKQKLDNLKRLFIEGKWFTNYIIAKGITNSTSYIDYKVNKVSIKVKDAFEERVLNLLSSQMKQYIIKRLQSNIKALQKLDKNGKRTGKIKYIKALHSIPLMQYGITYKVDIANKSVHIQGLGDFKVSGLDQIPEGSEMATSNLIELNDDYFLHVVTYIPKQEKAQNKKASGIDLGIKDQIAFSNGIKVQYAITLPERAKRLYHAFSKSAYNKETKTRSKRGLKLLKKINKKFTHANNEKKDINNKIAHYIAENYQYVAYQNDSLRSWLKLYGRGIYQTSIGEFRNTLKRKVSTPLEIGRFEKTTGVCINCGASVQLKLSNRVFTCPLCGYTLDRDVSAAMVIKIKGLSLWNIGETLVEDYATTSSVLDYLKSIPHVKASIAVEARSSKQADRVVEALSVWAG